MITINYKGRLGNNLTQYAAGYILASKTGLHLSTLPVSNYKKNTKTWFHKNFPLKLEYINFEKIIHNQLPKGLMYEKSIELNDSNYYHYLNSPEPGTGYKLNGFFQDSRLLCDHRDEILDLYQYNNTPETNISQNDALVACRLGDCLLKSNVTFCTTEYIENQLKINRHNYRNIYLTSDSLDYPPLVKLIDKYNITPYNNDPLKTILFAKNFNNLVLSAGSFSYWMAYLSQATNITVYNANDPLQQQNAWDYNKNVKFSL